MEPHSRKSFYSKLSTQSSLGTATHTTGLRSEVQVPASMPRILGDWDMTAIFIISIYLPSFASTAAAGGPAAITYLVLVGAAFFIPCLVATAQLGSMYPYAGGLYNWAHRAIGGYWGFFAGFCAWFPGVLIASSIANLLVIYVHSLTGQSSWLVQPWQQGVAICVVLILSGFITTLNFRAVQYVVNGLLGLMLLGSFIIVISAIVWLATGHGSATNFTDWSTWQPKPVNFVMFGVLAFAFIGAEVPMNMAGEMVSQQTIKRHLVLGGILIFFTYLLNTVAVLIVVGDKANDDPLVMVQVVDLVLGRGVGIFTTICLIGSFFATILVYNYLYARLLLVAGMDQRLPKALGRLSSHRVPANATFFQTSLAIVFTVLTFVISPLLSLNANPQNLANQIYNISQASATLVWIISTVFLFITVIGCYKQDPQTFKSKQIMPLPFLWIGLGLGLFSCLISMFVTLFYSWTPLIPQNQWWYLVASLTIIFLIISALLSMIGRSEAEWQEMFDDMNVLS